MCGGVFFILFFVSGNLGFIVWYSCWFLVYGLWVESVSYCYVGFWGWDGEVKSGMLFFYWEGLVYGVWCFEFGIE